MPRIEKIILRCVDPDAQRRFYCDFLSMTLFDDGSVGYGGEEASLLFQKCETAYTPAPNDVYWKIALAVPDIELACRQLIGRGIPVGTPRQFSDIAYHAHFTDPEGFAIELIDHWFKGNRPAQTSEQTLNLDLFGGGACLNLLTLRSSSAIEAVIKPCLNSGMKMLSIMPVEPYGFTLYFLAQTTDTPPTADPYAVENREWLFQRKYTVLEIQHIQNPVEILSVNDHAAGYAGTVISVDQGDLHIDELGLYNSSLS